MNKVTKRLSMGTLAVLMLFGGMFAYSANASTVQGRSCPIVWRTSTRTSLFYTQHANSGTIRTVEANQHVVNRGTSTSITNGRRGVTHNTTNGWMSAAHLISTNVTC